MQLKGCFRFKWYSVPRKNVCRSGGALSAKELRLKAAPRSKLVERKSHSRGYW